MNWMALVGLLALWIVGWAVFTAVARRRSSSSGIKLPAHIAAKGRPPKSGSSFSALVNACLGDASKARRLIQYEKSRNARLNDEQAAAEALRRLADDRYR